MTASGKAGPIPVTVTWLEMTARTARHVPQPVGPYLVLLRARRMPLHFYRYLQDRVGRAWHWVNRLAMDDDALARIIHADTTEVFVLQMDGAPAGFFELDRARQGVTDIAYFGLMEHATGRGIGRWLLSEAVQAAWQGDPERITVNTCTLDHPAALPLYQKAGFSPVGQSKTQITPLRQSQRGRVLFR